MFVLDFLRQQMPAGWKHTPSGWISGNCPMCSKRGHNPDKRSRGGIRFNPEHNQFQYNCFNCGFKTGWRDDRRIGGKLQELLVTFGTDPAEIQRVNLELLRLQEKSDVVGQYIEKKVEEKLKIDWPKVALPPDSYRIGEYPLDKLDKKNDIKRNILEGKIKKFLNDNVEIAKAIEDKIKGNTVLVEEILMNPDQQIPEEEK